MTFRCSLGHDESKHMTLNWNYVLYIIVMAKSWWLVFEHIWKKYYAIMRFSCTRLYSHKDPTLKLNSLAPGKSEWNFRYVIFKYILVIDGWYISCEIALIWMPLDFTDDQSTLVWIWVNIGSGNGFAAWWHQAITWAKVDPDLCHHVVSLGHNELNWSWIDTRQPLTFILNLNGC